MTRALIVGQAVTQTGVLGTDNYGLLALVLAFVGGVVFSVAIYLLIKTYEEGSLHRGFSVRRG